LTTSIATGIEFAAELFDLCQEDMKRLYPSLVKDVQITIYDVAPQILSMFDTSLSNYALETFRRDGIKVKTEHHIEELRPGLPGSTESSDDVGKCLTLKTRQDGEVGIGMCVWSTGKYLDLPISLLLTNSVGLMMNPFIQKALADVHTYPTSSARLNQAEDIANPSTLKWQLKRHPKTGGLMVDDRFRVKIIPRHGDSNGSLSSSGRPEAVINDVFALGDVSVMEKSMLPATAQVANQEAKWLGKRLNKGDIEEHSFTFRNLGIMTYLGNTKAIMQTGGANEIKG
jgi:NADH dehydrogenase